MLTGLGTCCKKDLQEVITELGVESWICFLASGAGYEAYASVDGGYDAGAP
jgi:hypothetical protein